MGLIFDLDLTLVDSSIAESYRGTGDWKRVFQLIENFTIYDGILDLLNYAGDLKIPIAIVTSSPSNYCQKVINHFNLNINSIVCYHDTKLHKPHPEPLSYAVNKFFPKAYKVISFGDRVIDMEASKAAGLISVACLWGSKEGEMLSISKPNYIVKLPNEAFKIIDKYFV
jgi:phosphoglycolate phosphatase-like HAD superfamily hydrolase